VLRMLRRPAGCSAQSVPDATHPLGSSSRFPAGDATVHTASCLAPAVLSCLLLHPCRRPSSRLRHRRRRRRPRPSLPSLPASSFTAAKTPPPPPPP
jgi:hypothetical protein